MYEKLEIPDPAGTFARLVKQHQQLGQGQKPKSGKRES
jgi:hypothetical protein